MVLIKHRLLLTLVLFVEGASVADIALLGMMFQMSSVDDFVANTFD